VYYDICKMKSVWIQTPDGKINCIRRRNNWSVISSDNFMKSVFRCEKFRNVIRACDRLIILYYAFIVKNKFVWKRIVIDEKSNKDYCKITVDRFQMNLFIKIYFLLQKFYYYKIYNIIKKCSVWLSY